jgi:hypothetical protein
LLKNQPINLGFDLLSVGAAIRQLAKVEIIFAPQAGPSGQSLATRRGRNIFSVSSLQTVVFFALPLK